MGIKAMKRRETTAVKSGRTLHDYDYEVLFGDKEKKSEEKERFDKNSLSEDDLDRINAIN